MSEEQIVAFRAIDRPVSKENLKYMRQQSTRAEITPWEFNNEYQYGEFRGNQIEMLRRGYDIHLHFANFGIRTLMIRLPNGLRDHGALKPYLVEGSLEWIKDKQGTGGCLCIEPCYEAGELEDIWEIDELLDRLTALRAELVDGDLRPLYLAHLAVAKDNNHDPDETLEAPVPAGLSRLSDAQQALAEFYCLSDDLIAAAATESHPLPTNNAVKLEGGWPTSPPRRTLTDLEAAADEITLEKRQKDALKAANKRKQRLAEMAADPASALRESERLVTQRSAVAYGQAAELLADLRNVLSGTDQAGLAEKQALKLKTQHPTLRLLISELRRRGFVPK